MELEQLTFNLDQKVQELNQVESALQEKMGLVAKLESDINALYEKVDILLNRSSSVA